MCAADPEMFLRLQQTAGGNIRLVTLAPEVEGAIAFIKKLVQDRIIVSLGHTAADNETIQQAVDAGAILSTHLGNGTCPELHKNNNPIIAQLSEDRLSASFIADGYHLSPELGLLEIVNPETGDPVEDGQPGEVVYTPLDARGTIVMRYRTGDLVEGGMTWKPCPACGRTVPRLIGRISRVSEKRRMQLDKLKGDLQIVY